MVRIDKTAFHPENGNGIIKRYITRILAVFLGLKYLRRGLIRVLRDCYLEESTESIFPRYATLKQNEFVHDWCLDSIGLLTGSTLGYSQEGEDILLDRWLADRETGFFVDVGAFHPVRFSNTYKLYRRGWRGLNIDATPGSMEAFRRVRPEDINIECAVSESERTLHFHVFSEGALNTFDAALAETYIKAGCKRLEVRTVKAAPLAAILEKHWPRGREVTLMDIDVEGEELNVLRSNDWDRYNPQWIILEVLDVPIKKLHDNPCVHFLVERGYEVISKLAQSVIFKRN